VASLHGVLNVFTSCRKSLHDWLHAALIFYTSNYMMPWSITWSITCSWFHYIYYMSLINDMLSLVAVAAAEITVSPQRARSKQSVFCWIHFAWQHSSAWLSVWGPCSIQMRWLPAWGPASGTAEVDNCRWWLGLAVLEISRMWLLDVQAILPISKI
jgi:hypothetical protein